MVDPWNPLLYQKRDRWREELVSHRAQLLRQGQHRRGRGDALGHRQLAGQGPVEALAALGYRLRGHIDELRPRLATTEERRLMSLPQVSVVLELARTAHTADRTPVLVIHQIRRGDGATFFYEISYPGR